VVGAAAASAAALWLLVRLLLGAAFGVLIALAGSRPRIPDLAPIGFTATLIVCLAVTLLVRVDARRMRESVFRANLGLAEREVAALAAGCALVLELALAVVVRAATAA
jgi:hypothetical protein